MSIKAFSGAPHTEHGISSNQQKKKYFIDLIYLFQHKNNVLNIEQVAVRDSFFTIIKFAVATWCCVLPKHETTNQFLA